MKTVLLVEDSKILQMVSQRSLTKAGYQVLLAEDGEKALSIAQSNLLDVIVLDMMLPKLSGPEVLRALKAGPETATIPVVVLTGLSQKNEDRLLEDGAAAFVEKSAALDNSELLLGAIRRALRSAALALGTTPAIASAPLHF